MPLASMIKETVHFIGEEGDYEIEHEWIHRDEPFTDVFDSWREITAHMVYEGSSYPLNHPGDWITAYPESSDIEQNVTYSLFIENVTLSSLRRIFNYLDKHYMVR